MVRQFAGLTVSEQCDVERFAARLQRDRRAWMIQPSKLGVCLRELRHRTGWGIGAVAGVSGISRTYLWQAERGEVNISVGMLAKLATAYGIAPSELVFMAEQADREVINESVGR